MVSGPRKKVRGDCLSVRAQHCNPHYMKTENTKEKFLLLNQPFSTLASKNLHNVERNDATVKPEVYWYEIIELLCDLTLLLPPALCQLSCQWCECNQRKIPWRCNMLSVTEPIELFGAYVANSSFPNQSESKAPCYVSFHLFHKQQLFSIISRTGTDDVQTKP